MNSERGNISLVLLVIGLFLAAVAHLLMTYVHRNAFLEEDYWRACQLRLLCGSVITRLSEENLEAGECAPLPITLQPGNVPATVNSKVIFSDDGCFRHLEVRVEAGEQSHNLRHVSFILDEEKLLQARQGMLISRKELLGTEFLSEETIYTSTEEVKIPQVEFLKNTSDVKRSISALSMEDVKQYGLENRFYYLTNASSPLSFTKNLKVYGTAVIATEGSVILGEGCQFSERVIFLSKGNITIKRGVKMPQALLLAYGKVSVEAGCEIGGVIFSDSNIELLGASKLTHDAEVVARFSSAFYIL